ncbi:hypothetical protein D3C78_1068680 [compost metagenome]
MHATVGDAGFLRALDHRIDQRLGTADVDMRGLVHTGEQRSQVELAIQAVDVEIHSMAMDAGGQFVLEGAMLRAAEGIVQFVVGAVGAQFGHLRHERGDADAAGDQHVATGRGVDGEHVVRGGDGQLAADFHLLVHEGRAALGLLFQTHADLIGTGVRRIAHQRIGVAELLPVGALHLHDHMAAAGEFRQRLPVVARQGEALDQGSHLFHCGYPHGEHFVFVSHHSPQLAAMSGSACRSHGRPVRLAQTARHRYFISR